MADQIAVDADPFGIAAGLGINTLVAVTFVATYFARDLQQRVFGTWPLGYWIAAQGAVLVFIGIVVVYGWAMNRFERQDAERKAAQALHDAADRPHG